MSGERDAEDRETDQAEGEHRDAHQIEAKVSPGSLKRGGEQKRRKKKQEYKIGAELHARHVRKESKACAGNDENNRVRRFVLFGEGGEDHHADEKKQQDRFGVVDVPAKHRCERIR